MSIRRVMLPVGNRRDAFNWFIGNQDGFAQLEANNEFGVLEGFISQVNLDNFAATYAADMATVHSDYDDFRTDTADELVRTAQVDNDGGLQSLIKVMVDELNAVRANAGLPNLNLGLVTAAVRSNAKKP